MVKNRQILPLPLTKGTIYTGEETPRQLNEEIKAQEPYWNVFREYILKNPYLWIISFANLLVYTLRSVQGVGTHFTVRLPLAPPAAEKVADRAPTPESAKLAGLAEQR